METEKYRTGSKRIWAAIVDAIVFLDDPGIGYYADKFKKTGHS